MIKLLKKWHWLHTWHTWTNWGDSKSVLVSYPWTPAGRYAFKQTTQARVCVVCNKINIRTIEV